MSFVHIKYPADITAAIWKVSSASLFNILRQLMAKLSVCVSERGGGLGGGGSAGEL